MRRVEMQNTFHVFWPEKGSEDVGPYKGRGCNHTWHPTKKEHVYKCCFCVKEYDDRHLR